MSASTRIDHRPSRPTKDAPTGILDLVDVRVWTPEGKHLLRDVSWSVGSGEHWALLGPNGAGKSTLLAMAGATRHPSAGSVSVLGGRLGRVDMPALRRRIGVVDPAFRMLDWLTAHDVVLTGKSGTIRPLWDRYGEADRARARELLALLGCEALVEREIKTCSQGERQRVRLARALMAEPELLLMDEPATGLDLPAREALLAALGALTASRPRLASVLVTHHLEELPDTTTHVLLLREGAVVASGPIARMLNDEAVSSCFGFPVRLWHDAGRWGARAVPGWSGRGFGPAEGVPSPD